jgi:putative nucleotidyltransferase with HDIG domain
MTYVTDWLELVVRWAHLIFGVAWIGTSFYFNWLNNHIRKPEQDDGLAGAGIDGQLWSIHGGHFYRVLKYEVAPAELPKTLHWFKWEAYLTWITGVALLALVYYLDSDQFLVDKAVRELSPGMAVGIGIGSLLVGWVVYDLACRSPLGRATAVFALLGFVVMTAVAYGLSQTFGSRAAYIHVGAILGTMMAANRDDQTGRHTLRVGRIAGRIGQVLGLATDAHELIARAAPLHDIGKIGISDTILLKQGRLDVGERDVIQSHTIIGADILSGSRFPLLQLAEEIALSHHERWDGLGYPLGLAGDSIPLSGRIVAVADVFDALTHDRPYKHAWTVREALAEIETNSGTQFDAKVVEALLRIAPEMRLLGAEPEDVVNRPMKAAHLMTAHSSPGGAGATIESLLMLQEERDELAREVAELRQQLAQQPSQPSQPIRARRWTQPN